MKVPKKAQGRSETDEVRIPASQWMAIQAELEYLTLENTRLNGVVGRAINALDKLTNGGAWCAYRSSCPVAARKQRQSVQDQRQSVADNVARAAQHAFRRRVKL